jgi:hypothetical protein
MYFFFGTLNLGQKFFEELQNREKEFGISDIQLGLTTLEEVFLNIARQAELESAAAEGRLATLTLTSGVAVSVSVFFFFHLLYFVNSKYMRGKAFRVICVQSPILSPLTIITQIPLGARFVGIPGTESEENPRGIMVEVYWEQDDSGTLCISGHSTEIPLPHNIQPMPSTVTSQRNFLGRSGLVHGVVFDPNQITSTENH